ncbi:MAG: flagellar hook-length control protein FliK [Nocardioidaceae bacterium]
MSFATTAALPATPAPVRADAGGATDHDAAQGNRFARLVECHLADERPSRGAAGHERADRAGHVRTRPAQERSEQPTAGRPAALDAKAAVATDGTGSATAPSGVPDGLLDGQAPAATPAPTTAVGVVSPTTSAPVTTTATATVTAVVASTAPVVAAASTTAPGTATAGAGAATVVPGQVAGTLTTPAAGAGPAGTPSGRAADLTTVPRVPPAAVAAPASPSPAAPAVRPAGATNAPATPWAAPATPATPAPDGTATPVPAAGPATVQGAGDPAGRGTDGHAREHTDAAPAPAVAAQPVPGGPFAVAAPTGPPTTLAAQPAGATGHPVLDQVLPSVPRLVSRGDGTHKLTLRLHPADLGEIHLTVTVRGSKVDVTLAAGPEARQALRQGSPELRALLDQTGHSAGSVVIRDLPASSGTAGSGTGSQQGGQPAPQQPGQEQAGGQAQGFALAQGGPGTDGRDGAPASRGGTGPATTGTAPDSASEQAGPTRTPAPVRPLGSGALDLSL